VKLPNIQQAANGRWRTSARIRFPDGRAIGFYETFDTATEAHQAVIAWQAQNRPELPRPRTLDELYALGRSAYADASAHLTVDAGFGFWLAGLIDGEGCFDVKKLHQPSFGIALREDDHEVLSYCLRTLGVGTVRIERKKPPRGQRRVWWRLENLEACLRLVVLLDRYPLRTKKLRDFVLWRQVVLVQCGRPRFTHYPGRRGSLPRDSTEKSEIVRLVAQMRAGRAYQPPGTEIRVALNGSRSTLK
jgi:hypothetical protein